MKVIIFSGFLGCGKTTLILSLAERLIAGGSRKVIILENEIGEAGIDDKVLAGRGYTVKTLLSGCICCSLRTELVQAIRNLDEEFSPDYVIFEPTGVAYPDRIAESVREYGKCVESVDIFTVVDARRWEKIHKGLKALAEGQLRHADFIMINKCDTVDKAEVEKVDLEIAQINGTAKRAKISALNGLPRDFWEGAVKL